MIRAVLKVLVWVLGVFEGERLELKGHKLGSWRMSLEFSPSEDDYAVVFQQQIRSFRENLDMESRSQAVQEDRISQLPNAVLSHILSFISSTKHVVRTSVLSKRWNNIWANVPNLYLDDNEFSSSADFIAFVDRVLLVRDSSLIEKFKLHFNCCHAKHFSRIAAWISTAVRCNVVEIDLSIDLEQNGMFELPRSLLTCKTLKFLTLGSMFVINVPTSVGYFFPSLKCLHIHFKFSEPDDYDEFIPVIFRRGDICLNLSDFPVLEYLSINGDLRYSVLDLNVSAPELKTFRLDLYNPYYSQECCKFCVDAPKLEKIDLREGSVSNFIFKSTKSLVEAKIDLYLYRNEDYVADYSFKQANEFLAQISTVKYLSLSCNIYQACSIPVFDNLSKLTVVGDPDCWKILLKLLERSPNLECLEIDDGFYPTRRQIEAEMEAEMIRRLHLEEVTELPAGTAVVDLTELANELNWIPPESVPSCLSSRLKVISIKGFKDPIGYHDEIEVTKYLLNNGHVLEKMAIYTPGLNRIYNPGIQRGTVDKIRDELELSMCGWSSKTVQVQVIDKLFYRCK